MDVVCGPLLRYIEIDYTKRIWYGSCLLVVNSCQPPTLSISIIPCEPIQIDMLDNFCNTYYFWRYKLALPLLNRPQCVSYTSHCLDRTFQFHLPAIQDSMRFMFYSCNGFSNVPETVRERYNEKEAPLWQDVLDKHQQSPFNVLLGGGDQLYQDDLISKDFMKPWVLEKDPTKRISMQLSENMKNALENYYFWNYIKHFGCAASPAQTLVFATIPSVNMWDDHDIIDGYGSYPADLQSSDCFQVLFANGARFYYLFQQHTTIEETHGMIKGELATCNHIVTTLGSSIGFLALDARGERTKYQICTQASYDAVFKAINELPPTVKHLIVLTGVPLIYPRLTLFEKAMEAIAHLNLATLVGRIGTLGCIITQFLNSWNGDPELLDDVNDHWTSTNHEGERRHFIERLQSFAQNTSIRVSFFGGDVHCCCTGRLYSNNTLPEKDPNFMIQIISSAIVNIPPPQILLSILDQYYVPIAFSQDVTEDIYDLFDTTPEGQHTINKKLMGSRNYCIGSYDQAMDAIIIELHVEIIPGTKGTKRYAIHIPELALKDKAHNQKQMLDSKNNLMKEEDRVKTRKKHFSVRNLICF
ncbi:uncharacterized protein B0P05DRAFT_531987 [Gilbertella persicaria]|uniref:uncharacterized protein n=1 Tax=Gilbertella persicaria TaxID=101096 RepID=UPI00221E4262|nr:uncharacterized protein B0P05DRAFT_531987 [Gilbertella persicaria]KAI8087711.1 hypothetical protein B0P05DRAFT_531987 [Gilbertella persicaria]